MCERWLVIVSNFPHSRSNPYIYNYITRGWSELCTAWNPLIFIVLYIYIGSVSLRWPGS